MNTVPATLASLLLLLGAAQSAAQTVYRCGPGGREYSQAPCPAGREVDVSDSRSADQRQAATAVVKDQNRLADQLAAERQARARSTPNTGPAGIRRGGPPDGTASVRDKRSTDKGQKSKRPKATKAFKHKPARAEKAAPAGKRAI